jgi:hypothetical protein
MEMLTGLVSPSARSIYETTGDVVMMLAAVVGILTWWRIRRPLLVSTPASDEEE